MEGLNIKEMKGYLSQGEKLSDFVLMDFEGEILFYRRNSRLGLIEHFKKKNRVIDLEPSAKTKESK